MRRLLISILLLCCAWPAWAATYYVRSTDGNDADNGLSVVNAWATVQKAADTAVATDLVLICADATHTSGTFPVDFDTNAGTVIAPVRFRGAAADGTDDGTVATISGASGGAGTDVLNINLANNHLVFENLRLTAGKDDNVNVTTGHSTWINCRFDTAADAGIFSAGTNMRITLIRCRVDNNTGDGISSTSDGRGNYLLFASSIHHNGGIGARIQAPTNLGQAPALISACLIYRNTSDGLQLQGGATLYGGAIIRDTTFFANGGDAIDIESVYGMVSIERAIGHDNGGYFLNIATGAIGQVPFLRSCNSNNNTSGHTNLNGGVLWGTGHVTTDPAFVTETSGSEDLTPGNADLAVAVAYPAGGTNYAYIGAIQPQAASGGGGPLVGGGLVQ